jgi:hypothetical protein
VEPLERRELFTASGDPFANAPSVQLDGSGSGFQSGTIAQPGDVGLFRFTAPVTGPVVVRQTEAFGSHLDSFLTVLDGSPEHQQIVANDDLAPGTLGSQVVVKAAAGQTYFVRAGGLGDSTGQYALSFTGLVNPHDLGSDVPPSLTGIIDRPGGTGLFRFTAPVTGQMTVRQERLFGDLDSVLTVFDSSARLVAFNDDFRDSRDSQVQFVLTAGQTYYVQASGFDTSTGGYRLTFSTAPANPFASAQAIGFEPVTTSPKVVHFQGSSAGAIKQPGDTGFFQFVAPQTGPVFFLVVADDGSSLVCDLGAFDGSLNKIPTNDRFLKNGQAMRVLFNTVQEQSYYVRAAGAAASTGKYSLFFSYDVPPTLPGEKLNTGGGDLPPLQSPAQAPGKTALAPIGPPVDVLPGPILASGGGTVAGPTTAVPSQPRQHISALGRGGEPSLVLVASLFLAGNTGEARGAPALSANAAPVTTTVTGQTSTSVSGRTTSLAGSGTTEAVPGESLLAAVEQVLARSLAPATQVVAGGAWLLADGSLLVLSSVGRTLGGEALQLADPRWQELANELLRFGAAAAGVVGDTLRSFLGGGRSPPAPKRPGTVAVPPPGANEDEDDRPPAAARTEAILWESAPAEGQEWATACALFVCGVCWPRREHREDSWSVTP